MEIAIHPFYPLAIPRRCRARARVLVLFSSKKVSIKASAVVSPCPCGYGCGCFWFGLPCHLLVALVCAMKVVVLRHMVVVPVLEPSEFRAQVDTSAPWHQRWRHRLRQGNVLCVITSVCWGSLGRKASSTSNDSSRITRTSASHWGPPAVRQTQLQADTKGFPSRKEKGM